MKRITYYATEELIAEMKLGAASIGLWGDILVDEDGECYLKTTTGWVLRNDLAPDPMSEASAENESKRTIP